MPDIKLTLEKKPAEFLHFKYGFFDIDFLIVNVSAGQRYNTFRIFSYWLDDWLDGNWATKQSATKACKDYANRIIRVDGLKEKQRSR